MSSPSQANGVRADLVPPGYFVWVTDFACRPVTQWWASNHIDPDNLYRGGILRSYSIAEEHAGKSHEELAEFYPCPEGAA